ncbi:flagellar radial spoke protein [Strigomonas culicis]|uniref:Flagellar radial spoke protein n=1 Tax=Strigomonas culicis TaxID=28005 RepID=S9U5Z2_9TRYP|nr:flagellar radial spoke protein [Strigomonas culicis]EPY30048.1 flagellar radial spoke protein [Strigomonas culicis]|eukprot:EPY24144.1 flagellar radial spoke protein [Strigomonas culicis]
MAAKVDENAIRSSALWNHMTAVLSQVVSERPEGILDALAPTSNYVLTGKALPPRVGRLYTDAVPMARSDVPADSVVDMTWATGFRQTAAPPRPRRVPQNGEEEEDEEPPVPGTIAEPPVEELPAELKDVVAEQRVLNTVGTGVPPEESYRLLVGLQSLARTEPVATVRLWGKVMGSRADYYIAEARLDANRAPEEEEPMEDEEEEGVPVSQIADVLASYMVKPHHATPREEAGKGLNELLYYAASTQNPTVWTRLPDVTPQQVVTARIVRCGFTGDLDARVLSHPKFPGQERHYLRAQIARINCATLVAPRDMYTADGALPDEEEDENGNPLPPPTEVPAYSSVPPLQPQEEPDPEDAEAVAPVKAWFTGYPDDELLQGKYWVHTAPTLLRCGRVTQPADQPPVDAEGAEPDEAVERAELIHPFLCDISRDATLAFPGHSRRNLPAWVFRRAFHNESSPTSTYVARSLVWPGAVTAAVTTRGRPGANCTMFYCGNGLKSTQGQHYTPVLPPRRLVEYAEGGLVLNVDSTVDEELAYAPLPARPRGGEEEDEENENED